VSEVLDRLRSVGSRRPAVAIGAALVVVLILFMATARSRAPFGVVLQGAEFGAVTGLLALGLVLTYKSDRIVNFAYGAMGGLAGGVAILLYLGQHWSYPVCLIVGLICGGTVGALTEMLVIRRFTRASRLVLTIATIGLAQVLGGLQLLLPTWLGGPPIIGGFPTPLSGAHLNVGPVLFTGDDLVVVAAVPVILAGLSWFLLRTDAGVAVRAVADNRDRALLLGIPIRRLALIVWVIGGVVAAIAVMLPAPSQGVVINAAAGPTLLLPALAAAVLAGMESLPVAFFAGIGLGVMDQLIRWNFTEQSVSSVGFLAVILIGLLLRPARAGRRDAGEEASVAWGASVVSQIPDALRRLPEVIATRAVLLVAVGVAAVVVPLFTAPGTTDLLSVALIFAMVAVSLVVLSGWAGEVSLGQFAFVGMGAVLVGDLLSRYNTDLFLSLLAAAVAGGLLAVVVGLPALRMRGLFLAVTTLAFAVAADGFFFNPTNFPSLIPANILRPVLWKRFDLISERALYYLCLGVLVVSILLVQGIRSARSGRVLFATRDNSRAAAAMGVPTVRVRLTAFVISGAIAGVAGGLHAVLLQSIGFGTYQPALSLLVFAMAVIGGLSSITGALLGVGAVELAVHAFPQYQLVITGTGLLIVLLVFPGGLGAAVITVRDRLLALVARRRGIDLTAAAGGAVRDQPPPTPPVRAPVDASAILSCRNIQVRYGPMQVLFGVDLDVAPGEVVALLGTNGAGKSTLLRAVCGLVDSDGEVGYDGGDLAGVKAEAKAARGVGMVPAKAVFPSLSVAENLRMGGWLLRSDSEQAAESARRMLELFPALERRLDTPAANLSGGEQQMLSLALALITRPKLLLIDELSLGLAPTVVGVLLGVVESLVAQGVTVVLVEQSVNVALSLAERAVFLEKGMVRFTGRTADLLDRPDVLRSVFIAGQTEPEAGVVPARANGRRSRAMVAAPTAPVAAEPPVAVLQCQSVVKTFGAVRALDGVELTLHKGEILGLIGHNGAGKTTLFDVVNGFLPADGGEIILGGAPVGRLRPHERAIVGLGRSFQEARLFPSLTVAESIAVALERHLPSREPVAAALRMPASTLSEMAVSERVDELLDKLGLGNYAEMPVGALSTGTRRIVELGCVLAHDPGVLLLDEPTGGVAQRDAEALPPLLRDVAATTGCSMLVIEHDMPLLTSLCDTLAAMELGRVIAEGRPGDVLNHPRVIESYLGSDVTAIQRSGARTRPAGRASKAAARPAAKRRRVNAAGT
jgi:ABC-type branched-subunit amino acid transport system ATPase component/ABC-type branched-subunit amino acid transport system permease subunit